MIDGGLGYPLNPPQPFQSSYEVVKSYIHRNSLIFRQARSSAAIQPELNNPVAIFARQLSLEIIFKSLATFPNFGYNGEPLVAISHRQRPWQ